MDRRQWLRTLALSFVGILMGCSEKKDKEDKPLPPGRLPPEPTPPPKKKGPS